MSRAGLTTAEAQSQLFLGEVEHGLNGAAEVHQAKGDIVNVAKKHVRREVVLEGEQCHRWEVVEHYDGQDNEDHFEGSLLHRVHLVFTGPRLPQRPKNHNVAKDHEGECCEDHRREDLLKVGNVACTFSSSVGQNDHPDPHGQDCSVLAVLQLGEGDGVDYSYITVQADAGKEEWREVFSAIEEIQHVPGTAVVDEDDVGQLQWRDETEEYV